MVVYCFKCPICKGLREVVRPMEDYKLPEICECGQQMIRNFVAEHSAIRGDFKKPIVSDSMAFDSVDLEEHRKRFPDVEVVTEGRVSRPILRNLTQKRRYLKGRNWADVNSFT